MNEKYHAGVCRVSAGYVVRVTVYARFLFFWWLVEDRSFLGTDLEQVMLWNRPDNVLSYCVHKTIGEAENAARDYNIISGEIVDLRTKS